jgi:hypothetical protein
MGGLIMLDVRGLRAVLELLRGAHAPGLGLLTLLAMATSAPAASENPIRVELNTAENVQNNCRLSFVIENQGQAPIETLKLDLALFGREGGIQKRMVVEMGPLRGSKTIVRAFDVDGDCGRIGSLLVNDVTACSPGDAGACLDRLAVSSRSSAPRLFK